MRIAEYIAVGKIRGARSEGAERGWDRRTMNREDVKELHYITPIENLPSILEKGILSHKLAGKVPHHSVALDVIQERRKNKIIPRGMPLHDYVNLYFDARNPMLYRRLDQHAEICILRVKPSVMELPGVVIADCNASSDYVRFFPYPGGLKYVDRDIVYAEYWTHPDDPIAEMEHKSKKCAEVLVPDIVNPDYLLGGCVSCVQARDACQVTGISISVTIDTHLFFR